MSKREIPSDSARFCEIRNDLHSGVTALFRIPPPPAPRRAQHGPRRRLARPAPSESSAPLRTPSNPVDSDMAARILRFVDCLRRPGGTARARSDSDGMPLRQPAQACRVKDFLLSHEIVRIRGLMLESARPCGQGPAWTLWTLAGDGGGAAAGGGVATPWTAQVRSPAQGPRVRGEVPGHHDSPG